MSTGWHPRVTALVPTYNGEAFIQRTLDSLAAQSWDNLEILIGEDCSTDGTAALVARFAAGRPDVRILPRTENLGWLRNSNDLMANATGELMFFAFHDDVVDPDYVSILVEALRANPKAVMAFTDVETFSPEEKGGVFSFTALEGKRTALARGMIMLDKPRDWWVPNRGLFRAAMFERIGGIKPSAAGEVSADWTWLLHMALLGDFVRVPGAHCHKYYKRTSLSLSWRGREGVSPKLHAAGVREVWTSSLPLGERLLLTAYGKWRLRRVARRLPQGVRRMLRAALNG